jgi:predicted RNA-binding protein with PIN domain
VEDVLIVDGYNVIGAWAPLQKLKAISLEEARRALIDMLEEYQSITGLRVFIVFDAYRVPGPTKEYQHPRLGVLFSSEEETADELIERLVAKWYNKRRSIFVATSDSVEQTVIFGQGAFRIPARELYFRVQEAKKRIAKEAGDRLTQKTTIDSFLTPEQRYKLERMRREK